MSWEDERIGPDVVAAGRLINDCISRGCSSFPDLEEALEASRYSSHPYSSPPKEWPRSIEVVNARELPPVLIDRYNAAGGEGTALCGIFPEIRRAWASVDNSLFLWRFDKWDGQCPEYSGEEQAICAVGLAKVKPNIFVEAIQYLLVLATPVELILLGVCCTSSVDGIDPYDEISLQPLPEYTIPSDGVTMTSVACTDKGQIFLAGRDSHIYELQYSTGSGWQKCCRKVCLMGGLGNLFSRWVLPNVLKFGAVDPIVELVIDNERHILYARTQESKIQVFDLGKEGDGPPKKVAEEKNLSDYRDGRYGGGRSGGSRAASRLSKTSIVSLATVSMVESKWIHLVAVASDGRRMYLSTASSIGTSGPIGGLTGLSGGYKRPSVLKVVTTRPSPSIGLGSGITFGSLSVGGRSQAESLVMKVETAYYSGSVLLLSDSSLPTTSRLIIVNRDLTSLSTTSGSFALGGVATTGRGSRALRETVSELAVEGRTLSLADVLPPPDSAAAVRASLLESCDSGNVEESSEMTRAKKLWARGDLAMQHILPRRRAVVFSTMGLMEIVFNRPVDILQRLLDSNAPRSLLEDFFQRFGSGEAAAMCLLLGARLTSSQENIVSHVVAEKAAEAFEDPRLVGMPRMQGASTLMNSITPGAGFNMGQVVQDAEPIFSGAHEGLCLCASRLLWPVWELPVMVVKGESGSDMDIDNTITVCRLPMDAMQILENKIRSLEQFLRSRRNQRRGLYGRVVGIGDMAGSILYNANGSFGTADQNRGRQFLNIPARGGDQGSIPAPSNKRQRVPYNPAELAAFEVRSMECIRRLLRRSGEALLLLQILSQHHVARLTQSLDSSMLRKLAHLTFHQLVCSDEGDQIATRLVAALMQYHIGPDGRGTVDDISVKLRDGCPSYYNESDYKFFQAVECLHRANTMVDSEEKQKLARQALDLLVKVPEAADLLALCERFEDLRFYEAVVELPLQKARALDPNEYAFNEQIDPNRRQAAIVLREQCYEVVMNALRSLKGDPGHTRTHTEFGSPVRHTASGPILDQASQERCIRQIVQLSIRWPDRAFHEYLYRTMIELGLENELFELAGPDLVPFLQNASRQQSKQSGHLMFKPSIASTSPMTRTHPSVTVQHSKYLELLARYYVHKRQHALAAHVFLRLAERRHVEGGEMSTLDQRFHYLSNAVLQARSASGSGTAAITMADHSDSGLLELLEGKLAVLRFQMKIKEELERIASRNDTLMGTDDTSHSGDPFPSSDTFAEDRLAQSAREKAAEISLELKSITQLYNDYAVPFELWEICLEILFFSNYDGDGDSGIMREMWARLLDQALTRGGVAEACSVLKRVGSKLYPGDGVNLPLDTVCLHLEKAAQERATSGVEIVGDEDVARALLGACKGAVETVQRAYDRLLSSGSFLPSPSLRVRLLRSVLTVLREWTLTALAQRMGTNANGSSLILGGLLTSEQTGAIHQGVKDKIISAANRYMTEVRRLALPPVHTEPVYRGFKELEEMLLGSSTF
ncbi:hypothetical protein KI387_029384 [Taxus chinensis]|uniref:Nuclear pore complex protein n=1 Tax=Taxus chinensis TaxID=29808 RepID=A0AA38FDH3_TAXCH|nr:hypothetical protein KI387_029384 [Taxus chinensis]